MADTETDIDADANTAADADADDGTPLTCHRRNCDEAAAFVALERYQEETGQGAVEAEAALCRAHAADEHPTNLDGAYPDYVFRVEPLSESEAADIS